ncbi:outer membrane protein [Novosphingobium sp. PY1]|uniref:Outer membrane protein beta-barrel domain-containing protein n=1 Tax=Ochrobactrum sp. PW1 TaxID=1882222 RepID=A0A292GSM8_9HYPH|nr:outer membrane protein [Novosphingobium sp. PY1]BBA74559.1 hypothetical protein [Ochrobactrum sp. PW1]GFM29408.1 uncharacterized protein PY1_contig-07-334 [Novosphingobium sp. PY1]
MRLPKVVLMSAMLGTAFAGTAFAEDFNGPFVGVQAGLNSDDVKNPSLSLGTVGIDDDQQAFTGGVYAGYDKRIADKFVLGVEGSFDLTTDDNLQAANYTLDPQYSFDLTARTGYLVTPQTLLYVRGGYANARIKTAIAGSAGPLTDTGNQDGWTVGGGVERQLIDHVSARLEYRYSDFSEGDGQYDRHRVLAGVSYRF